MKYVRPMVTLREGKNLLKYFSRMWLGQITVCVISVGYQKNVVLSYLRTQKPMMDTIDNEINRFVTSLVRVIEILK